MKRLVVIFSILMFGAPALAQDIHLKEDTRYRKIYNTEVIRERHRHRYEFNNNYMKQFEDNGLIFSGLSCNGLVEVIEIEDHPWFVACQFHPEFTSNPRDGHIMFTDYIKAGLKHQLAADG